MDCNSSDSIALHRILTRRQTKTQKHKGTNRPNTENREGAETKRSFFREQAMPVPKPSFLSFLRRSFVLARAILTDTMSGRASSLPPVRHEALPARIRGFPTKPRPRRSGVVILRRSLLPWSSSSSLPPMRRRPDAPAQRRSPFAAVPPGRKQSPGRTARIGGRLPLLPPGPAGATTGSPLWEKHC